MTLLNKLCDPHWILCLMSGYMSHVNKLQTVGFMIEYTPDGPNTIFVLAFSLLLAEYELWPCTLRKPPPILFLILEGLICTFWINIIRSLVWIPFSITLKDNLRVVSKKIVVLNSKLGFHKRGVLVRLSRWLASESSFSTISLMAAIGIFTWVLHATDTLDQIKQMIRCYLPICEPPKPKGILSQKVCAPCTPVSTARVPRPPPGNLIIEARGTIYSMLQNLGAFTLQDQNTEPPVNSEQEQHQLCKKNLSPLRQGNAIPNSR